MDILFAFTLKMIDNIFSTAKTIYISKEKYLIGSILNAAATFFYLVAIVQITKDNSLMSIFAMCLATFIGTYLPGILIKQNEKDKLYIFDITANDLFSGIDFADDIRELGLAINTHKTYDSGMTKTLACKIFCETKEESRMVVELLNARPHFKYNVCVPID